ncbi:DUF748 domain-containing protein [Telluribacter sp. SYSU D00476]|uniref:DUF748 domain-containing protein n=1 Tax=Telluribacter sp. SYSU D00476 TaxID=2811430 RepID=UPI001FF35591|nr:DUF748 domain-containing protein [Telluribacter sp. SYSU D00476]
MRKSVKILLGLVVLLIIARLLLPYFVVRYVNKVLSEMDGYTGRIEDVNISLLRGAYQIEGMNIQKVNGQVKEPFIKIPLTDLSVEWESLWKGKLVGEVITYNGEINFAFSEDEGSSQTGVENDWTQVVKDLMPIEINRFAIVDGQIDLTNVISQPGTDLSMKNFQLQIENIRNVEEKGARLPSPVRASGDLQGYGGKLNFKADMNLLKKMPDLDYQLNFDNVQLVELNKLAREYADIDFEKGTISIYSELAMYDGKLEGYVKPLTKDMQIFKLKEENNKEEKRGVGGFIKELLAEGGKEILENQKKEQVATNIPLQGDVSNVNTSIWPILGGMVRNAYIEAFKAEFDNSVQFYDLFSSSSNEKGGSSNATNKANDRKQRREQRKQERKERREERKKG